jgi:hypothetical protein
MQHSITVSNKCFTSQFIHDFLYQSIPNISRHSHNIHLTSSFTETNVDTMTFSKKGRHAKHCSSTILTLKPHYYFIHSMFVQKHFPLKRDWVNWWHPLKCERKSEKAELSYHILNCDFARIITYEQNLEKLVILAILKLDFRCRTASPNQLKLFCRFVGVSLQWSRRVQNCVWVKFWLTPIAIL